MYYVYQMNKKVSLILMCFIYFFSHKNLFGEITLKLQDTTKCIETLKNLDRHTNSTSRNSLIYNIQKGEV